MRRSLHHHQASLLIAALAALSTLGCGSKSSSSTPGGAQACTGAGCTAVTLQQLSVSPSSATIAMGTAQALTATGLFSDGSQQDLSSVATWTSSDASVVTLGSLSAGQIPANGSSIGTAQVAASYAGVTGSATVEVTAALVQSLVVTPASAALASGTTQQLAAFATFTDGSTSEVTGAATWSTSSAGVATVVAGLVSAAAVGPATVSASYAGFTASAPISVTPAVLTALAVVPGAASLSKGVYQSFTATGTFSDMSRQDVSSQVAWIILDASIAEVSATGTVHALQAGSTTVRASLSGITGEASLTVTDATAQSLSVTPSSAVVATGVLQTFAAIAHFSDGTDQDVSAAAAWSSSDGALASITSSGVAQGLAPGNATVTATFAGLSASATLDVIPAAIVALSVAPATATLASGTTQALRATAIFTDGSTQDVTASAQWTSSVTGVATVGGGVVRGVAAGSATVTASYSGFTASTRITVTPAVLTALSLTPTAPSVPLGLPESFTATGIFSDMTQQDLTTQVAWTVLDPNVATVDASGLVTTVAVGGTTVRASLGGITGETSLTVTAATLSTIDVAPSVASIAKGTQIAFVATGTYSDGTTADLTASAAWASSSVAVSFSTGTGGVAIGTGVGSATITAAYAGVSGAATLTVTAAVLRSIAVAPSSVSLPNGFAQQLAAQGTFSDGSTQDLTAEVAWLTSDGQVAAVSNATGAQGLLTAMGEGHATVTATLSGVSGSCDVTVTPATLQTIAVASPTASLPAGYQVQLTATATLSDGSTFDVTSLATWTSSNSAVATVSTAGSTRGLVTGVALGTASIRAALDGISGQATLTVSGAKLDSVSVAPNPFTVAVRGTSQLTATGTFNDGTTLDVTRQCVWNSSNRSLAWVSKKGVVTGVGAGSVTITAKKSGKRGSASGTVR